MRNTSSDLSQKALQIKHEDKFFSRLLSKENSAASANPSFRVYYGDVSGSVPFTWESQPGTPKYTFSDTSLPPLTPPPSYYSKSSSKPVKKRSRSGLLYTLFPKMISLKRSVVPSSPSSLSSSLSSSMFFRSEIGFSTSNSGSSFDSRVEDEDTAKAMRSPTSTLCFTVGRGSSTRKLRGCYGW